MNSVIVVGALLCCAPLAWAAPPLSEPPSTTATPRVQPIGKPPLPQAGGTRQGSPFIRTANQSCAQVDYPCDKETPCCEGLVCKPVGSYGSMCEKKR